MNDDEEKTPTHTRHLSGTAINLLDVSTSVLAIARALDRAVDDNSRAAFGRRLVDLGREIVAMGKALVGEAEGKT